MNSREKGKRGERELAKKLREYGFDARRGVQYQGGQDSPDVVAMPGVHIECKRVERLQLYDAMAQAKADCGDNIPVVMHRKNNCEWLAIMRLEDFVEMYRESERLEVQMDEEEVYKLPELFK